MNTDNRPLAAPKDNLLGICNALGEDFGFNPLWLRLALGAAFVIQPIGVVATYLALGLAVLVSRLAFPKAKVRGIAPAEDNSVAHNDPVVADYGEPEYAKAA